MKFQTIGLLFVVFSLHSASVFANMGALLVLPQDPKPVVSLYIGYADNAIDIDRSSTDYNLNTAGISQDHTAPLIGGAIGLENSYYRFSLSYDYTDGSDLEVDRFLMNFDFKLGEHDQFKWLVGTGIGVAQTSYDLDGNSLKQSNGIMCLRGGTAYNINSTSNLDLVLEYSFTISESGNKSYNDGVDFTSYKIDNYDGLVLRLGYNFIF